MAAINSNLIFQVAQFIFEFPETSLDNITREMRISKLKITKIVMHLYSKGAIKIECRTLDRGAFPYDPEDSIWKAEGRQKKPVMRISPISKSPKLFDDKVNKCLEMN